MKVNKLTATIIIFIIILMVVFLFFIPTYKKMNNLQNNLNQKQAEYDGKFIYYTKIVDIIKNIDSRKDVLEKIKSALPSDFYFSSLVYFFQKEATNAKLSTTSITLVQISPPNKKTKIRDIIFNLHVTGTYESFKIFLSTLDTSARLFEVNSVSFSTPATFQNARSSNTKLQTYDFNIEIQTHVY
ncbi:MAG: hypothetical protein EXS48_01105 [Candidatus Staskawiczbacteria bacterium]|nr:hypothetical protein [Candidatus Staskawiczbacteria bacterium]